MGLRAKFNLAFLAAFAIGFAIAGVVLWRMFQENARQEVLQDARIMMSAANGMRSYTDRVVVPLLVNQTDPRALAPAVPSFAARESFKTVQAEFPNYSYGEPTLNPTDLVDRPTDWQADLIHDFRNHPTLKELVAERETPTGPSLSLSRPITINDPQCLACHSTPAAAPPTLIAKFGSTNGFGWKLHETVGAQVVSVPMSVPLAQARRTFIAFMVILLVMFLVILAILNVLLHFTVVKPVVTVARIANAVSLGEAGVEEYERRGSDEIASLSASFNRMRRSLDSAMRMLER